MGRYGLTGLLGLIIGAVAGWIAWTSQGGDLGQLAQPQTQAVAECAAQRPAAPSPAAIPAPASAPDAPRPEGLILLMAPTGARESVMARYRADIAPAIVASGGRAMLSAAGEDAAARVGVHDIVPIAIFPSVGGARTALRGPAMIRLGEMLAETGVPFVLIVVPQVLETVTGAG